MKTICYCFDYSEDDIRRDLFEGKGTSSILERIVSEKKKGTCRCATLHPESR